MQNFIFFSFSLYFFSFGKIENFSYESYEAKNAEYSKKYCWKKIIAFQNLQKEDNSLVLENEREKAKKRHPKSRDNRRSKLVVELPTNSRYLSNQGLSRATNRIRKVLPASTGKKREVIKNLSNHHSILDQLARKVIDNVKEFYQKDSISHICPGRRDTISVKYNDEEKMKR